MHASGLPALAAAAAAANTTAAATAPGRLSAPVCRSGGEPPASTRLRSCRPSAPRGNPAPPPPARLPPRAPRVRAALRGPAWRRLRARSPGLAEPVQRDILYSSSLAAVILNRQEHKAYIYRETRVSEAAWAPFGCLFKNFYNLEGNPHFNKFVFGIWSFRPEQLEITNSQGGPYCF